MVPPPDVIAKLKSAQKGAMIEVKDEVVGVKDVNPCPKDRSPFVES